MPTITTTRLTITRTPNMTSVITLATRSTGSARVAVLEDILSENDRVADANRHDFAHAGVRTVNLMSSPGAGKTTLLKRSLAALRIDFASAYSKATSRRVSTPTSSTDSAPRSRSSTRAPGSVASATSTR